MLRCKKVGGSWLCCGNKKGPKYEVGVVGADPESAGRPSEQVKEGAFHSKRVLTICPQLEIMTILLDSKNSLLGDACPMVTRRPFVSQAT
jgi:hypothetical protein